jgi:hypothetical protein
VIQFACFLRDGIQGSEDFLGGPTQEVDAEPNGNGVRYRDNPSETKANKSRSGRLLVPLDELRYSEIVPTGIQTTRLAIQAEFFEGVSQTCSEMRIQRYTPPSEQVAYRRNTNKNHKGENHYVTQNKGRTEQSRTDR